jgi:hypothetical protein
VAGLFTTLEPVLLLPALADGFFMADFLTAFIGAISIMVSQG